MTPLLQAVVPAAQTPGKPLLQEALPPGLPLSTTPSQSLSRVSQTSVVGWRFWLHMMTPLLQALVPAAQTPGMPVLQEALPPGLPLSTTPSQSLSRVSQTCVVCCRFWLHMMTPLLQALVPGAQTPSLPLLQGLPPPGLPLSTTPSQLLSRPSQ